MITQTYDSSPTLRGDFFHLGKKSIIKISRGGEKKKFGSVT